MSNSPIDPADFMKSVEHLPMQEQITRVKDHVQSSPTPYWHEFVTHPVVCAWITLNATAINAHKRIPKSHGG